jgi:hypothetical protein
MSPDRDYPTVLGRISEFIQADKIFAKICLKADKNRLNILNHCSTMSSESRTGLKSLIYLLGKDFSDSVLIYLIVVIDWGLDLRQLFSCEFDSVLHRQRLRDRRKSKAADNIIIHV